MTIDLKLMDRYWMESYVIEDDGKLIIPPDWSCCQWLMQIRRAMVDVARSGDELFRKPDRVRKGRRGVVATEVGRRLENCIGIDLRQIFEAFPHHRFDPYFDLFAKTLHASPFWRSDFHRRNVTLLNKFVEDLRAGAKAAGFMKSVKNHERGTIKNARTVKKYIGDLYGDYPKILHVRLDLSYQMLWPRFEESPISAMEMKADRGRLMRYVRNKFKAKAIGHMWTVEYGAMKGPHFHLLLHFNGHEVRQGITIAHQVGEHWQHVITKGRGRYWNVNKGEDVYEAMNRRGIGLISHADQKRRGNLLETALYLVKTDLFVRVVMPGFGKTFGHGRFQRRKKSNAGRKRKIQRLLDGISAISAKRGQSRRSPVSVFRGLVPFSPDGHASQVPLGGARNSPSCPSQGEERRPSDPC